MPPLATQVDAQQVAVGIDHFLTAKHLHSSPSWLETFISTIRLNTPLPGLQQTALFRILATDITSSLQVRQQSCFPANASDPNTRERQLLGPAIVQVLDIEDVGRSRWSQVEAIEMEERGEMTKGREVIRIVAEDDDNSDPNPPAHASAASAGPHKLLLQDSQGNKLYAFELDRVHGISVRMAIGSKLVLRNVVIARGVAMLEPRCVEVLGGKVEAWDKQWREQRKNALKEKAGWREGGAAA